MLDVRRVNYSNGATFSLSHCLRIPGPWWSLIGAGLCSGTAGRLAGPCDCGLVSADSCSFQPRPWPHMTSGAGHGAGHAPPRERLSEIDVSHEAGGGGGGREGVEGRDVNE